MIVLCGNLTIPYCGRFFHCFYLEERKNCATALAGHRAAILFNRCYSEIGIIRIFFFIILVSKKFVSFKKPMNPSKFQTHPAVLELFALCAIPAVSLKGRKNTSANNA